MSEILHILVNQNSKLEFDEAVTLNGLNSFRIRIHKSIVTVPNGATIVTRYHNHPFKQLAHDLALKHCNQINKPEQRIWLLNLENWTDLLGHRTPQTINITDNVRYPGYPVVVRSDYGTLKHLDWSFVVANNQAELMANYLMLCRDTWHSHFSKYARKLVLLQSNDTSVTGVPLADEWRIFYYKTTRLAGGSYWTETDNEIPQGALDLADESARLLANHIDFFVIDVARKADQGFIVIEVNDANSAGLQNIQPGMLYNSLCNAVFD